MKTPFLVLICCLSFGAYADEKAPSTGDRVKSDAKAVAKGVAKASKDVGNQIGTGTKKAIKSIKTIGKTDVRKDTPGDGNAKRQSEKMGTAKAGRK